MCQGSDAGFWPAPTLKPPATSDDIAALQKELGFSLRGYTELLLLADGFRFDNGSTAVAFGGTGGDEDDVRQMFNYSEDYGRSLYRRHKQVWWRCLSLQASGTPITQQIIRCL